FSTEFLHVLRQYEIDKITTFFHKEAHILEIGGGTGYQAKQVADRGFKIVSIDVPTSNYSGRRVYPVVDYDGRRVPFRDSVFDIVFSSNALEHVLDLDQIYRESLRVLKPKGYWVHVMPSAAWRFWTSVAHYVELLQRWTQVYSRVRTAGNGTLARLKWSLAEILKLAYQYAVPPRHGEAGTVITELWRFSRHYWIRDFRRRGFAVVSADPIGLFYTGHMVLGKRWSLNSRERTARLLGSACVVYKISPQSEDFPTSPEQR